ncbi:hypothetical protein ACOL3B_06555 [Aliarcobacter butzleri]
MKTFLILYLSANEYMDNCVMPDVLLTENETSNLYLIRKNKDIILFI